MKQVIFKANDCKLKIIYKGYLDSEKEGLTGEDDKILGFGRFTMKGEHKAEMLEYFGQWPHPFCDVAAGYEWEDGYDYETYNTDMFIFYVNFLINTQKNATIEVEGEHIFWFIHDVFHAMHDVCGADFSCGAERELQRFRQGFQFLKKKGLSMSREYISTIVQAFNERKWGCYNDWVRTRDMLTVDGFKEEPLDDYYLNIP
jgi:hypothetical protein